MNLLHRLGWRYLQFLGRREAEPVEWTRLLALPGGRILVCLPDVYEAFLLTWRTLLELRVDRGRLAVVAPKAFLQAMGSPGGEKRVGYESKDVNVVGLAKKRLVQRVRELHPGVAIDLSGGVLPLTGHLCLRSGAAVRASLGDCPAPEVYNFFVRLSGAADHGQRIRVLLTYLSLIPRPSLEAV
ncbi:MAG: hypothetical protein ONB23_13210 [candidate division KSB1 bacterium]|nr:hypothetical protein [candidate division KSB1 bacterium]